MNSPAKIFTSLTKLFLERERERERERDVTADSELVNFSRRRAKAACLGLLFFSPEPVRVAHDQTQFFSRRWASTSHNSGGSATKKCDSRTNMAFCYFLPFSSSSSLLI